MDTAADGLPTPPELAFPPFGDLLTPRFYIPFMAYFVFFSVASRLVRTYTFQDQKGFRQYRLHNLTVCVLHSVISGSWCLAVFLSHLDEAFNDVIHWYDEVAAQLPVLSIAYFVHDAIHMLRHEWSPWTLELLAHHVATTLALLAGLLARRFLLADYWALLMEVNSIFLHLRTIMQLTGQSKTSPRLFNTLIQTNLITFILFRFVAQLRFAKWSWDYRDQMHWYYFLIAFGGEVFFSCINGILFVRVLAADGYLGEKYKSRDRDAPRGEEEEKKE